MDFDTFDDFNDVVYQHISTFLPELLTEAHDSAAYLIGGVDGGFDAFDDIYLDMVVKVANGMKG